MPEYLAPGVYVEEVSFRSKSIEGVSTTTTGFIGPAAYGPLDLPPDIITSLEEFERTYGGGDQLVFKNDAGTENLAPSHNYLWHAVRAFFAEGGRRLYVARVFRNISDTDDGRAHASFPSSAATDDDRITVKARFPGAVGNMRVRFTLSAGPNILAKDAKDKTVNTVGALTDKDIVWNSGDDTFYQAVRTLDAASGTYKWTFVHDNATVKLETLDPGTTSLHVISLTVTTIPSAAGVLPRTWPVALDPNHESNGSQDSLFDLFTETPDNPSQALSLPIVITPGKNITTGLKVWAALTNTNKDLAGHVSQPVNPDPTKRKNTSDEERSVTLLLAEGNDGKRPGGTEYEGKVDPDTDRKTGLKIFEDLEDISIVAAPGATQGYKDKFQDDARAIISQLIIHATQMRYRIAVLDSGDDQSIAQVRAMRAQLNSKYAALYYPWVRVLDPITRRQISLPPSGFVAGIYARNDTLRAVYKAPANEVVNLALGFERLLNKAQQEVLNPEGVNCFRFFEGRGYLLWGARMATDDPEWKYVNLRRYFAYLERSIDIGTQWAVFEPNGPNLWANVTRTIENFLLNEWTNGALLGEKPEKAYFVRCDRSTMTQNDLDNGRLVCLIGVAPLRPAEFVIFRIGQWTGDATR